MEERRTLFTERYQLILITLYTLLMAMVIFFLAIPRALQIGLLLASVLVLVWMLNHQFAEEPPCGTNIGAEAIDRPRAGHSIPVGPEGRDRAADQRQGHSH